MQDKNKGNTSENANKAEGVQKPMRNVRYRGSAPDLPTPRVSNEAQTRKIIVYGSIVTAILVAILSIAALLQRYYFVPNEVVATVGNVNITRAQLERRIKINYANVANQYNNLYQQMQQAVADGGDQAAFMAQLYQQQLQQLSFSIDTTQISKQALDGLIAEQLIKQESATRGITVSTDEGQKTLERDFGFYRESPTPYPTNTPGPTVVVNGTAQPAPTSEPRAQPTSISDADLQTITKNGTDFYTANGYSEQDFKDIFVLRAYEEKLQAAIGKDAPKTGTYYKFDYLRFGDEAMANAAAGRLTSGAISFAGLITETNNITDSAIASNGTVEDWTLQTNVEGSYGIEVVNALDKGTINKPTGVFTTSYGSYMIALPLARETRALSDDDLKQVQSKMYQDWIKAAQEDKNKVSRKFDDLTQFVPKNIRDDITRFRQQQTAG